MGSECGCMAPEEDNIPSFLPPHGLLGCASQAWAGRALRGRGGSGALTHPSLRQDGRIEFSEFIQALSVTSRGTLDEKLRCKCSPWTPEGSAP